MMGGVRMRGLSVPPRNEALEQRLAGAWGPVFAYEQLGSTMEIAHELAAEGAPEGSLVFARRQEQGRGRLGRTWASPEGGAYFSLILRPLRSPGEAPQLALVAGLAAAEAVNKLTGLYPSIRWPNDLLLEGKKLAGILTESRNGAVVLGIGINVTPRPEDLPDTATSLAAAGRAGKEDASFCCRLTVEVCHRLKARYEAWSEQGFAPIRDALRPWIGLFGHPVHITAGSDYFEGTAQDVDERGRLVVRLDSGIQRAFEVGEVTLLR